MQRCNGSALETLSTCGTGPQISYCKSCKITVCFRLVQISSRFYFKHRSFHTIKQITAWKDTNLSKFIDLLSINNLLTHSYLTKEHGTYTVSNEPLTFKDMIFKDFAFTSCDFMLPEP